MPFLVLRASQCLNVNVASASAVTIVFGLGLILLTVDPTSSLQDALLSLVCLIPLCNIIMSKRAWRSSKKTLLPFAVLIVIYCLSTAFAFEIRSLKNAIILICVCFMYTFFRIFRYEILNSKLFAFSVYTLMAIMFLVALASAFTSNDAGFVAMTLLPKNYFGVFFGTISMIGLYLSSRDTLVDCTLKLIAFSFSIFLTAKALDHRTQLVIAVLFPIACFTLVFACKRRSCLIIVFLSIVLVNLLVVWVHTTDNPIREYAVSRQSEITDRRLESGRDVIWPILLNHIEMKPWLGHGGGVLAETFTGLELSAHNQYIQVAIQTGLVGLAAVIWLLFMVFLEAGETEGSGYQRAIGLACISTVILENSLEVFLLQNNIPVALLSWALFGLIGNRGIGSRVV